jgi:DNA-binding transcriptional MerR regulator
MAKAPPAAIDAIVQKARDRGLSRNSIASILTILRDASIKGLYIDPVIDKIQEGLSKNIRPDIIERVALRVMARITEAEESLEGFLPTISGRESIIETILEARDTGLSNADIREVLYATSSSSKGKSYDPDTVVAMM